MKRNRWIALLLALALVLGLAACGTTTIDPAVTDAPTNNVDPVPDETPNGDVGTPTSPDPGPGSEEPDPAEPEASDPVDEPVPAEAVARLAVLSGPTGIGAAKLLADSDSGAGSRYDYVIAADNSELVAGLTGGTLDIATVASNVALNLYNKTDGGVQILALGTLGVLHILESGGKTGINSVDDLVGKTIWSAGQGANPEYILRYILRENGIDPDRDVTILFADASEITQKLMTGEAEVAMLPVPAATAAVIKGEGKLRAALDVTELWNELDTGSDLVMTAVVARTQFIRENPEAVKTFLADYKASIEFVTGSVDEAAELIAGYGITPNAAIAKQAIPQCHLTYIAGRDMAPVISGYYEILWQADPASVGGALPDDGIYYVP